MSDVAAFWDTRFAEPGYKYGSEPNAFLRAQAAQFAPAGKVLVPGDGEGRNGVWLARQGHAVTTVDLSAIGLQKARALAEQSDVAIVTVEADLADWSPGLAQWDAVCLVYTHLPSSIRRSVHRKLAQGLRPGGRLVLEAFHPAQLALRSGGPKDLDLLYTPEQLDDDFAGLLQSHLSWQGPTELDEGPGHQGPAHVTRWVGSRI
jgi:SAM-dependent methyltransferase